MFANWGTRKPVFSGFQQHAFAAVTGTSLGYYGDAWMRRRLAARDSLFYQYIQDHPEDFPIIERKKFIDVLETWIPIR